MWEIWSQSLPWTDVGGPFVTNKLYQRISQGERPPDPPSAPAVYIELMHACWATDPAARPTFAAVLQSPIFAGIDRRSREDDDWCLLPAKPV